MHTHITSICIQEEEEEEEEEGSIETKGVGFYIVIAQQHQMGRTEK